METSTRVKTGEGYNSEGVTGLKALGARDLNYRLAFLAGSLQTSKSLVSCIRYGGVESINNNFDACIEFPIHFKIIVDLDCF